MSNNSNRILLFTTAFRPFIGGSEIAIEEIAKRLPELDFDIVTPRYTRKLQKEEDFGNMHIYRVGWGWLGDKFIFPLAGFLKAHKMNHLEVEPRGGSTSKYDIAHTYQASYGGGAAYLFKLFNPDARFILTLQEGKDLDRQGFWIKFLRKIVIKKADQITAISNFLKDYARRFNKKVKIAIIPNGVDVENFSNEYSYGELSELTDRLGIKPGEKIITSVSRLVPKNGIDVLIKAFAILTHNLKPITYNLVLIGDGPERKNLELLTTNYSLETSVIFVGSISHAELPKYLKISDVFVRPSRSEGLGIAFLEAMAAGVSIIGTKVGGIPDFLKNKETGLFAEVDNQENLAEKINLILTDKELREKLVKNAKELVVQKYDWNKIADEFKELYSLNI